MRDNRIIFKLEEIGIIKLILLNKTDMMLLNIAYLLRCNFNLIFFSQLRKARILYYNYLKNIILKKAENIIGSVC